MRCFLDNFREVPSLKMNHQEANCSPLKMKAHVWLSDTKGWDTMNKEWLRDLNWDWVKRGKVEAGEEKEKRPTDAFILIKTFRNWKKWRGMIQRSHYSNGFGQWRKALLIFSKNE